MVLSMLQIYFFPYELENDYTRPREYNHLYELTSITHYRVSALNGKLEISQIVLVFCQKKEINIQADAEEKDAYKLLTIEKSSINSTNLYYVLSRMFSIYKMLCHFFLF